MLRLHYFPPMCSLASMSALELAGAEYEPVLQDMVGDRAALLAISPLGQIPVLEAGDAVITDTIAIIYWLAQTFPQARLLPENPAALTAALSKMAWLGSHLHVVRRRYARPQLFGVPDDACEQMRSVARPIYWTGLSRLDTWIADDVLGGPGVDAYAFLFYHWATIDGLPVEELEHFSALAKRMTEIPGIGRALQLHDSPLIAAT